MTLLSVERMARRSWVLALCGAVYTFVWKDRLRLPDSQPGFDSVSFLNKIKLYRFSDEFLFRNNELYVLIRHSQNEKLVGRLLWEIKVKCLKESGLTASDDLPWKWMLGMCQCWGCLDQMCGSYWGWLRNYPSSNKHVTVFWKNHATQTRNR